MEIKNLMLKDLVRVCVNKETPTPTYQDITVIAVNGNTNEVTSTNGEIYNAYDVVDIPLYKELLLLNDFVDTKKGFYQHKDIASLVLYYERTHKEYIKDSEGNVDWNCAVWYALNINYAITSIRELQHYLRVVGMADIADNLTTTKVEESIVIE